MPDKWGFIRSEPRWQTSTVLSLRKHLKVFIVRADRLENKYEAKKKKESAKVCEKRVAPSCNFVNNIVDAFFWPVNYLFTQNTDVDNNFNIMS